MWAFWKKSKPAKSAEERVQRFLKDYQAKHLAAKPLHERADKTGDVFNVFFPQWVEMLQPVKKDHFTEGATVTLGDSYGDLPFYASRADEHVRSETDGSTTYVLFAVEIGHHGRFHEYVVEAHTGEFKISDINIHYQDPIQPFVDAATIAEQQKDCAVDAPLVAPPENEALLDHNRNFTEREVTDNDGDASRVVVEYVGELTTNSGVLAVGDFGWDNDDACPLARTVPPGTYPVDRITAYERNAAIRVKFSEEHPLSWWLANRVGTENDTVGVDAGCIYVADYPGYAGMTPRAKAAAYEAFCEAELPSVGPIPMGDSGQGFATNSGWGDGSYPVYWGLDANDQVAQLVVDFLVLTVEEDGSSKHL